MSTMENFEAELMKECEGLQFQVSEVADDGDDCCFELKLPIAKIDGVAVHRPRISFRKDMVSMTITINGGFDEEVIFEKIVRYKEATELTLEFIQEFMKNVASTLKSLRFDAFTTTFVERPRKKRCWEYFEADTVQMKHGPCACQCGEVTRRKTPCEHHLCLRCEQRIVWVSGRQSCPICRAPLNSPPGDDSDSDNEW